MAYDPNKDQLLWESPTSNEGLMVQVKSYAGNEPKVKCMRTYTKRDGTVQTSPAFGLTLRDFEYIGSFWNQIKQSVLQNTQQQNPNQGFGNQNQGFGG